jgi:hypothetical protein
LKPSLTAASVSADGLGCPAPVRLLVPAYSHSFYPLFPAWLGLALWTLGETAFVYVQSLFVTVGIIALYLLGVHFGGKVLGICVVLVQLFFPHNGISVPSRPL